MIDCGDRIVVTILLLFHSKVLQKYFKSTSKYFKSTSSLPKYIQSTSGIFEVTWKYDIRTYVIIAKIKQVACFAVQPPPLRV